MELDIKEPNQCRKQLQLTVMSQKVVKIYNCCDQCVIAPIKQMNKSMQIKYTDNKSRIAISIYSFSKVDMVCIFIDIFEEYLKTFQKINEKILITRQTTGIQCSHSIIPKFTTDFHSTSLTRSKNINFLAEPGKARCCSTNTVLIH